MLTPLTTAAADLTHAVEDTARQLDAVGAADLTAALSELDAAAKRTGDRLDDAAAKVTTTLTALAARLQGIAGKLAAALAAPSVEKKDEKKAEIPSELSKAGPEPSEVKEQPIDLPAEVIVNEDAQEPLTMAPAHEPLALIDPDAGLWAALGEAARKATSAQAGTGEVTSAANPPTDTIAPKAARKARGKSRT